MLPQVRTDIPGPRSRAMAEELRRWESPNVTYVSPEFPVFWESASGCLVTDVDGNVFLDLSAGFGAAAVGHGNPRVVAAVREQAGRLMHGMGDVHPPAIKVDLLRTLARVCPGDLCQAILTGSGAESVEAALKTAVMVTGRAGVIAFEGAYHGLTYGALAATGRESFRAPFREQLGRFVRHAPYPQTPDEAARVLEQIEGWMGGETGDGRPGDGVNGSTGQWVNGSMGRRGNGSTGPLTNCLIDPLTPRPTVGAVLLEPIQGRGGIIVPPEGWFTDLHALCHRHGALLIADEVFTGFGRTGRWFASEVAPDILCVGKAMGGGFPIGACVAAPETMAAWGESTGEALHTSTFLGNPLGCAAALAAIAEIEEGRLVERAAALGDWLRPRLDALRERHPGIAAVRGRGLMWGLELRDASGAPDGQHAARAVVEALRRGVILLPAGPHGNVLELVPPYAITEEQLGYGLGVIGDSL